MTTTQKVLWLPEVGADFTLGEHEIPEPGPGEVLVQLQATALNPLDWKIQQSGFYMIKEYPAILGEDGAGIVRKAGAGVTNLTEGDRVSVSLFRGPCCRMLICLFTIRFFQTSFGNKYDTYQQYCLTEAAVAVKVSDCRIGIDFFGLTELL